MLPILARLPLEALAGPENPLQQENLPAALSRTTVQLCFVSRPDAARLQGLELELQRAWLALPSSRKGRSAPVPSILRGCFVRFVSSGSYHISRVARSWEEPQGELMLELEGFGRPVPASCLSKTNPLADPEAWEQHGREEVEELARTLAARLPLQREIAAACCRLSTAWLWAAQRDAFAQAVRRDPAAVAAALEDAEAVAALLPCLQAPPPPHAPSPAKSALAAAAAAAASSGEPAAAEAPAAAKRQRVGPATSTANSWQQRQPPPPPPPPPPPSTQPPLQLASRQPAAGQVSRAAAVLPPGSRLVNLLLQGVAWGQSGPHAVRCPPWSYCTLAVLGHLLDRLDGSWRVLAQGRPLKQLALELCTGGLLVEGPPHATGGTFRLGPGVGRWMAPPHQ